MRVLLADDHDLIREGLRPFLEELENGTEVVEAGSLEEALDKSNHSREIDLFILDLNMPGMDGFNSIKKTAKRFPNTPIVVISGQYTREDVMEAIDMGAAGYIPKTMSGESIINALRLVLSGERYVPPIVLSDRADEVAGSNRFPADNPLSLLSERELDILKFLVEGKTNKEIGLELDLKEITVKLHLRNIFKKLSAKNRTTAVRIALKNGWKL